MIFYHLQTIIIVSYTKRKKPMKSKILSLLALFAIALGIVAYGQTVTLASNSLLARAAPEAVGAC